MRLTALGPGDVVDIVAPAGKCSRQDLSNGLRALRALGLNPRVPRDLFAPSVLFANTDARRLAHLRKALYAADSKLVWCVRGGYGSLRLVPEMLGWQKPKHVKLLLGYSDITTLHAFLNHRWGWPTVHGPMVERFGRGVAVPGERKALLDLLFGRRDSLTFSGLKPLNAAARGAGRIHGPVFGGNMAVLQSTLGTRSRFPAGGKILFFEDIGERPHRVDRMLEQFRQAGWFDRALAVAFGHFLLEDARDRRQLWSDVIPRFSRSMPIPVVKGLPVGHDPRRQMPLAFGTRAELRLGAKPVLVVNSPVARATAWS